MSVHKTTLLQCQTKKAMEKTKEQWKKNIENKEIKCNKCNEINKTKVKYKEKQSKKITIKKWGNTMIRIYTQC